MNLELNVVRFENEDVIATSGDFCPADRKVMHVKVTGDLDGEGDYNTTMFRFLRDEWTYHDGYVHNSLFAGTPNKTSYYYYDSEEDKFVKCDGTHNPDVAKEVNYE